MNKIRQPSGGQEIKLKLTFTGPAQLTHKMKLLLRGAYSYDYEHDDADAAGDNDANSASDSELPEL